MELTEDQKEILRMLVELGVEEDKIISAMCSVEEPQRATQVVDNLIDLENKEIPITRQVLMETLVKT